MRLAVDDRRCIRARRALSLVLDYEARPTDVRALAVHLGTCESCRLFAARVGAATRALRTQRPRDPGGSCDVDRRRSIMKRIAIICVLLSVLGAALAATAVAQSGAIWTTQKAEKVVVQSTLVQLPASQRAALEQELLSRARLFWALWLGAMDMGDPHAGVYYDPAARLQAGVYYNLASRFSSALRSVRDGLTTEQARCAGAGRASSEGRFARFRCSVTSESLDIPSVTLLPAADDELPAVVQDGSRIVGPMHARLSVHVSGQSTIGYRQMGVE
jgi:hypothetical protein